MKFSEAWLREWVDPQADTGALAHQLTMAGLEVDAIEPVAPAFHGVVVGYVMTVGPHPDADRLRLCSVDVGQDAPLTIVCGAANVAPGMRVPAALIGAELPGGLKIKKSRLRGVESFGMLCSAVEIGIAEEADGLLPLPDDAEIGADVRDVLALDDVSIELGLTPNRGDCLGIEGIAREAGVLYRCDLNAPSIEPAPATMEDQRPVVIEAADDCARYVGRVVRGIDPKTPTPLWMKERLRRSGLRSLGIVVDVTNYVLLELGQPMHAFDLDKLSGGVTVRRARAGEPLTLLDGQDIELDEQTLVIADDERALAMAGVMGGADSAVSDTTRSIFFESAWFNPTSIAGRARSYGLHTDSSHRFERGVSPQGQVRAIERATGLLLSIAGGEAGPLTECVHENRLPQRSPVTLRADRLSRVLGFDVPANDVGEILQRLGLSVTAAESHWEVIPPAHRFDIAIEEDLIEEVVRIHGYDHVPEIDAQAALVLRPDPEERVSGEQLADILVDRGYQEAITYSFVDPSMQALFDPGGDPVELSNPISADLSVMRTGLWPGLMQALIYNRNRQQDRVRLFEQGLRFVLQDSEIKQDLVFSGVVAGSPQPEQWGSAASRLDFFDVKADVESLIAATGDLADFVFVAAQHPALHPGQSAQILRAGQAIGWLGMLHPRLEKSLDLDTPVYLFELELAALMQGSLPAFAPLSRFPAIRRDISVTVDDDVTGEAIRACVAEAGTEAMQDVLLFDIYRGKGVDSGRKSVALGLILQDSSRTLIDEDVERIVERVLMALQQRLGASLRE